MSSKALLSPCNMIYSMSSKVLLSSCNTVSSMPSKALPSPCNTVSSMSSKALLSPCNMIYYMSSKAVLYPFNTTMINEHSFSVISLNLTQWFSCKVTICSFIFLLVFRRETVIGEIPLILHKSGSESYCNRN